MVYHGRVKGGVVELDAGVELAEGTRVSIVPESADPTDIESELGDVSADPIWGLGRNPVSLDITDASTNLDQYIYDGR